MRGFSRTGLGLLAAIACGALTASGASAAGSPGAAGWGANSSGQLGDGTTSTSLQPTPIAGLTDVSAISAAKDHALALLASGKVMAWGKGSEGQLGNGSEGAEAHSDVPVEVTGITSAVAVAAGDEFSLALLENGTVVAWGLNAEGQLGDGSVTNSDVPQAVAGLSEVTAIAAGTKHALALLKGGTVMAWGADGDGQLGNGTTSAAELEAVPVSGLTGVTAIAAGGLSSYAILGDGTVEAWGSGAKGQLGDGSTENSDVPEPVKGVVGGESVSAGENHALALVSGGAVYAWGNGAQGELGNGQDTSSDEAVEVESLSEATAVAAGSNFSLALLGDGTVASWGADNEGQLGNGTTTGSDVPATIPGLAEASGLAAASAYALEFGGQLPAVTSVSPGSGPAAGGTAVKITGTGFSGVKSIHFGSASASFSFESASAITATAPAGTGIVDVSVTVPGGTSPAVAADHFSYAPVVSALSPSTGPQAGGTEVIISGANLAGVSAVSFGASSAQSFKEESAGEVIALSPAGVGTVDVRVSGPGGTSEAVAADEFTYGSSAPELGRCVKASKKHKGKGGGGAGEWANAGCTEALSEGKFEWLPGAGARHAFRLKAGRVTLQTGAGAEVECKSAKGSGEYSGARSLKDVALTLEACSEAHVKCQTAGAAKPGEVISAALRGEFGIIESTAPASQDELGLDLSAAGSTPLFEFECGSTTQVWRGSVIAPAKANKMEKAMALGFAAAKDHQKVERFEGESVDVPESSTGGAAYEAGALTMALDLKGQSEIEISSVH